MYGRRTGASMLPHIRRRDRPLFQPPAARHAKEQTMTDSIKVGVIADQTGPLSFVGIANANVAKMVIGDINTRGGLLGRPVDLHLKDGATNDSTAAAADSELVVDDHVDVIFGGIFSSTRQAIKGPAVVD